MTAYLPQLWLWWGFKSLSFRIFVHKANVTARFCRLPSEAKLAETDSNQSAFMVTLNLFSFGTTAVVEFLVRPMSFGNDVHIYRKSLRISEAHAALPPRKYILYECKWLPTISWHLPWDSVKYSSFTVEIDGDTSLTKSLQEKKICLMLDSEETEAMRDSPYTHVGLTWLRDPLPTGV